MHLQGLGAPEGLATVQPTGAGGYLVTSDIGISDGAVDLLSINPTTGCLAPTWTHLVRNPYGAFGTMAASPPWPF